jgi:hypothetical protein
METKKKELTISIEPTRYEALEELAGNKKMTVQEYIDFLFKDATTFNLNPEPPEVSIEVPLTPEQYTKLRAWVDANDFLEILPNSTAGKATIINTRKLDQKNHPDQARVLGGELLGFRVRLLSPFVDFIDKYLDFFNEPGSLEAFITGVVYEKVWSLYSDLTQFVKIPGHRLELQGWLEKFPERIHGNEDEENDC